VLSQVVYSEFANDFA